MTRMTTSMKPGMKCSALVLPDYHQPLEVREFDVPGVEDGGIIVKIDLTALPWLPYHVRVWQ